MPVNFQAMLLQPNKKTVKKLREVLHELYKHLDSSAAAIIDVSTLGALEEQELEWISEKNYWKEINGKGIVNIVY